MQQQQHQTRICAACQFHERPTQCVCLHFGIQKSKRQFCKCRTAIRKNIKSVLIERIDEILRESKTATSFLVHFFFVWFLLLSGHRRLCEMCNVLYIFLDVEDDEGVGEEGKETYKRSSNVYSTMHRHDLFRHFVNANYRKLWSTSGQHEEKKEANFKINTKCILYSLFNGIS